MNKIEREKMVRLLDEKVLESAAKHQALLQKEMTRHGEELSNLKIAENTEMDKTRKEFAISAPVTHLIHRGDLESLKEAIKKKWIVTSFKKDVSEQLEIADKSGCINPELIKKPFCFEYISTEE